MSDQRRQRRLEDLHPNEIPELLRLASELHARERAELERAAHRAELLRAADEAGLPRECLERAARVIDARRDARARQKRAFWVAAALLAVGLLRSQAAREPAAPPAVLAPLPPPPPPSPPMMVSEASGLIDLSSQVTDGLDQPMLDRSDNNLADLGAGVRILGGVPFKVNGAIVVGPGETSDRVGGSPVAVPSRVDGIEIGRTVHRLYFLEGTHYSARRGMKIGAYLVHHADGSQAEIPIRYGEDVLDWWARAGGEGSPAAQRVVWRGRNSAADEYGTTLRLFMQRWENPHPELSIDSLGFVTGDQPSGSAAAAPFVVGITAR